MPERLSRALPPASQCLSAGPGGTPPAVWSAWASNPLRVLALGVALALGGCGGGGDDGRTAEAAVASTATGPLAGAAPTATTAATTATATPSPATSVEAVAVGGVGLAAVQAPAASSAGLSASLRSQAARVTAENPANDCGAIRPFYWELGDAQGTLASGSVRRPGSTRTFTADSVLRLASASKWLYAAYVAERRSGALTDHDLRALTMRSGMVGFSACKAGQTVDACLAWKRNALFSAEAVDRFYYGGGHFQKHASDLGLGTLGASALATEWRAVLGHDLAIDMDLALPSGGAQASAATYARFLRKLLSGELALATWLGQGAVCADATSTACGAGQVLKSPGPEGQTWHYGPGHWIEDDPRTGDGAYSSGGAFGFYPWIDASRSSYGIVAREAAKAVDDDSAAPGQRSARCGRLIRQAWSSGVAT